MIDIYLTVGVLATIASVFILAVLFIVWKAYKHDRPRDILGIARRARRVQLAFYGLALPFLWPVALPAGVVWFILRTKDEINKDLGMN